MSRILHELVAHQRPEGIAPLWLGDATPARGASREADRRKRTEARLCVARAAIHRVMTSIVGRSASQGGDGSAASRSGRMPMMRLPPSKIAR